MSSGTPTGAIEERPMTPFQVMAVSVCVIVNMLDGFDILVIAFTAPEIALEWDVSPQSLGTLFSAAPIGMAFGALFIGPIADRIGRRMIIIVCLVIITIGMLSSAFAESVGQLFMLRLVTGLGIGGILPSLNTIVAEYSSSKRRDLSIGFMHAGYPIGALVCGSISTFLIAQYSWQAVFVAGGIMSTVMLVVVIAGLPESLEFLLSRQPANALSKVNQLLGKLGNSSLAELPAKTESDARDKPGVRYLLSGEMLTSSLLLWCAFFLTLFTVFFLQSWTPQIFVEAGFTNAQGRVGGIALSLGGIAGGLALGYASAWFSLATRVRACMGLAALSMVGFIVFDASYNLLLAGAFVMAFFVFGSLIGLYAAAPRIYPTAVRVTGIAWGIGIGRIGAIAGPYVAGLMIGAGLPLLASFVVFAAIIFLAMVCMFFLKVPEPTAA